MFYEYGRTLCQLGFKAVELGRESYQQKKKKCEKVKKIEPRLSYWDTSGYNTCIIKTDRQNLVVNQTINAYSLTGGLG